LGSPSALRQQAQPVWVDLPAVFGPSGSASVPTGLVLEVVTGGLSR
jgi:hypothetical protein